MTTPAPSSLLHKALEFVNGAWWDELSDFIDEYPQLATLTDSFDKTLLSYLSEHGATAPLLKKLILLGADPNFDGHGYTPRPIGNTITHGNEWGLDTLDELATLLDMGADPNTPVEDGYPALHLAIVRSKPRHLALLLEKGADIHTRTSEGETLLEVARRIDSQYTNKVLREYGILLLTERLAYPSPQEPSS